MQMCNNDRWMYCMLIKNACYICKSCCTAKNIVKMSKMALTSSNIHVCISSLAFSDCECSSSSRISCSMVAEFSGCDVSREPEVWWRCPEPTPPALSDICLDAFTVTILYVLTWQTAQAFHKLTQFCTAVHADSVKRQHCQPCSC